MLEFNPKINLIMQAKYKYDLQDVAEPNLYREIYDYKHIPKIAFNMRHVPEDMPDEIWLTDTTFRDGQQSVSPFTPEQIVRLFKLMSRLGGPRGIIRQSEFFLYTDRDREALRRCQELGLPFPEITTWIRANEKDFQLVKDAGVKETGILVSCSDYHIFHKMHLTRGQALDKYLGIVKAALEQGIDIDTLVALPARERIGRLKYAAEDEAADEFARAMAQLEEEIAGAASEEEPN